MSVRPAKRIALASVAAVPAIFAVLRALSAAPLPAAAEPSPTIATIVAQNLADAEPAARKRARQSFPGDRWSQDDDFHNHEARLARALAARHGIPLASVFALLDADLRSHRVPNRQASAAPCKPRPFYE